MSAHSEFVAELASEITTAAECGEWDAAKADLAALSEQIVQALIDHRDQDVRDAYESVERSYSALVTRRGLKDTVSDTPSVAAELRALTRLLSIALQYRKAPGLRETAFDSNFRPLLEAIRSAPNGLSGRELAAELNTRPETIARKLPILRSAGLVRSQQVGRTTINTLTAEARAVLGRERPTNMVAEEALVNEKDEKKEIPIEALFYSSPIPSRKGERDHFLHLIETRTADISQHEYYKTIDIARQPDVIPDKTFRHHIRLFQNFLDDPPPNEKEFERKRVNTIGGRHLTEIADVYKLRPN
jgi:DNA-binding transcriptional ArsR family regulator